MTTRRLLVVAVSLALLAACTGAPASTDFDESGGVYEIAVHGDGFVRFEGERVPLEAAVLTLRQRLRPMAVADRARIVVQLRRAPVSDDAEVARQIASDLDRLLQQCQIMGVQQARYL